MTALELADRLVVLADELRALGSLRASVTVREEASSIRAVQARVAAAATGAPPLPVTWAS